MKSNFLLLLSIVMVGLVAGCARNPGQAANLKSSDSVQTPDSSSLVVIRDLSVPGAIEVENLGPDVELAHNLTVQRQKDGKWMDDLTDLKLIETCQPSTPSPSSCVQLPRNGKLRPLPWSGFSCDVQYCRDCRGNSYLGPGTFRFAVSACDGATKAYGPAFELPQETKFPNFFKFVVIRNLSVRGAVEIENLGLDVGLAGRLTVQQQKDGKWTDRLTDVNLVESCASSPPPSCVRLPHNGKLRPLPWTGLSCDPQHCGIGCLRNSYLGPGTFRFAISACSNTEKAYGPAFELPADKEQK